MHLLLVVSSLGGGGAERVMSRLAEGWVASGIRVTLATFDSQKSDFYSIQGTYTRRSFTDERSSQPSRLPGVLRRGQWLRSVMRETQPDAIISFTDRTNVLALAAAQGLDVPLIVSERVDPTMYSPGRLWSAGRTLLYRRAAAVVVQTRQIQEWARSCFPHVRSEVIPNPAPENVLEGESHPGPVVVAAGRLCHQKGFDLLIDAFAAIAPRHPEWGLKILGDGENRPRLQGQIDRLGMNQRIELTGRRTDAVEIIASSSIFVLSSRYEGFPNVLVEAMATGRAVIATDCRSGPADLIEPGVNGLLVPPNDTSALSLALERLVNSPELRLSMGQHALGVRERLSLVNILSQWNQLIESVVNRTIRQHAA